MRRLSDYLAKFTTITAPEGVVKEAVAKSIEALVGIRLQPSDISVMRSRVQLRIDSVRRSEIMLHKAAILRKIAENLPGTRVVRELL